MAVIAVVLFHAYPPLLRGGFLGVDIFFVLSGFLITGQLLREVQHHGGVHWRNFFKRRLIRLQPALLLLLLAYSFAWVAGWIPTSLRTTAQDILTVLFAWAHWARAFEWHAPDYLGHAWSLGIEEQFYLIWAAALAVLGRKLVAPWRLALLAAAGALASSLWMQWLQESGAPPTRLYNGLDTRAMGLLWGCALAGCLHTACPFLLEPTPPAHTSQSESRVAQVVVGAASTSACVSLTMLLVAMMTVEWRHPDMFRWGYTGAAILTSVLVGALVIAPSGICSRVLGCSALVNVGKISYGLYLWHYPVIRILEAHAPALGLGHTAAMAVALFVSAVAATGSYLWLEQPLKRSILRQSNLRR